MAEVCGCCGAEGPGLAWRPWVCATHLICQDCVDAWYDTGITDPGELKAEVERRRKVKTDAAD